MLNQLFFNPHSSKPQPFKQLTNDPKTNSNNVITKQNNSKQTLKDFLFESSSRAEIKQCITT